MNNLDYILMACDSQDFDDWFLDSQYYAEGDNSAGSANKWVVNFDDWSTNNQNILKVDFNAIDWQEPTGGENCWAYPSAAGETYWSQYQYRIYNTKLYNDPTNNTTVADMQSNKAQAFMFPTIGNTIHAGGVGSVSFKYRVVDTNVYSVIADMALTNTFVSEINYRVEARVKGGGENFDDGDYQAIRLRQVDANNYVECRVVQTHGNRYYLEIWLCDLNGLSLVYRRSGTSMAGYRGSLEEGGRMIAKIEDSPNAGQVKVRFDFDSLAAGSSNQSTYDRTFTATALRVLSAPYGFAASGANMLVSGYLVNDYDGGVSWWEESFLENEFSVMQFNNNWKKVITTNDTVITGSMDRMGVGDLSLNPSTGLNVSVDPGDNQITVPEHQDNGWIPYSEVRGLTNLDYQEMVINVNTADNAFAIIDRSIDGFDRLLPIRFYDIEITGWVGDVLTQNDWLNNYGWVQYEEYIENNVTYINNYIELRRSKALSGQRQYVSSARYTTLGSFGFKYMIPTGSALPDLKVWKASNLGSQATWVLVTDDIVSASDARDEWLFFSRSVGDDNDGVLIVENASAAGSDAIIRLDDITIYPNGGGSDVSWSAYNARLTGDEKTFDGIQSGFLNLNSTLNTLDATDYNVFDPYIRTPKMNSGIGEISFWYAMLENPAATLTNAILKIEKSSTGDDDDWSLIAKFEVANTDYHFFSTNMFDTVSKYVRFTNITSTNGVPQRLALDDLLVIDPYATTLDVKTVRTVPEQPLDSDIVKVQADLTNYKFGPYDIQPVTYYRYGTEYWGTWEPQDAYGTLPMELIATDTNASPVVYTYQTTTGIPVNPPGTCVQYYVKVSYDGEVYADKTSPEIFRQALTNPSWYEPIDYYTTYGTSTDNNPYYIVYSCPPGAVWFNEVNIMDGAWDLDYPEYPDDTGTNGYVELTGKAGINLSNWIIEIYDYTEDLVGRYSITDGTSLGNDKDGYGFWVLGAPEMTPKNMAFTNNFNEFYGGANYLPAYYGGGIVLKRDFGAIEYKVCYNDSGLEGSGFQDIGDDWGRDGNDSFIYKSLQLTGSGSNYVNFVWSWEEGFTPGTVNTGQTISGGGSNEFTITVTDYWFDGTTVYIVSEGTGDWNTPEVWYSTNLVADIPEWSWLDNVTSEVSGSIVTQQFNISASPTSPTTYYRIQGQED
jgi:hypothetical protein